MRRNLSERGADFYGMIMGVRSPESFINAHEIEARGVSTSIPIQRSPIPRSRTLLNPFFIISTRAPDQSHRKPFNELNGCV